MSGIYNMVFGSNSLAMSLLGVLEVTPDAIPRYRDCFLNEDGTQIIIYTRTGGNNREDARDGIERLRAIPGYISDADDSFDNTYALFRYAVPELIAGPCKTLAASHGIDPAKRWEEFVKSIPGGPQ